MTGYVAMRRDWQDHDLFEGDEFSRRDAWAWMIAQAAWKATSARVKGSKVDLQRGEMCFSQRFLAEKWGWSKSRVDRFIALLRAEGMIATRSKIGATAGHNAGQGQSIITVCNYDKYQPKHEPQRGNAEPDGGATAGQQRGKEEKGNNSVTDVTGGSPADPVKQIFDLGVALLVDAGSTPVAARSMIGRWRKEHGDGATFEALNEARMRGITDPKAWITARLAQRKASGSGLYASIDRKYGT